MIFNPQPKPTKKPKALRRSLRRGKPLKRGYIKKKPRPSVSQEAARYVSDAHKVECVICKAYGMQQLSPTSFHHWIMGRFSQRRTPDLEGVALCDGHHQANFDDSKIAVHSEPEKWKAAYGRDKDWSEATRKAVQEYRDSLI